LAFYVYDVNGDGQLDKEEFERVQELLLNQSNVGQKHRDHSSMGMSFKKAVPSALVGYFFGPDGKQKLDVERFLKFQVSYLFLTNIFT
jgi:Ca2+-binding EF-hand superfamily protein